MTTPPQPMVGPIQLIVIGYPPDARFTGETMRALSDLRGRGVIRIIDALFVRKDVEGRISASIRESDFTLAERERMGAVVGGLFGLATGGDEESEALGATLAAQAVADNAFGFGLGDLQEVNYQIKPGTAALLLLIEHRWALELKSAVRGAGGVPIVQGFLTPEALFMVGAEVRAISEAQDTIAVAQAIEGAALLAAMATVQASEMIQQAAVAETARVLIAAGLIEAEATAEVIEVLRQADLIKEEALEEAKAAVLQAEEEVAAMKAAQQHTNGTLVQPEETTPVHAGAQSE
jgi:uncharacterized membrane protein